MPRQTVSLCLIVKDGEPYIEKCLASVVVKATRYGDAAFDEILVLVDDRTSDRTEEIARRYATLQESYGGVLRIERHTWPNDFSIANDISPSVARSRAASIAISNKFP